MKENFDKAIDILMKFEGGFVNDPQDPGGMTKYGISKKAYPNEDIANLCMARAKELYKRDYWDKVKADDLPDKMDLVVFDTAVNMGVGKALLMLKDNSDWQGYLITRLKFYSNLVQSKPSLGKFLRGWLNRVIQLYDLVK